MARTCTFSVISSKPLPSSNLVTQSPDLKPIQDGRGIYGIMMGVFCAWATGFLSLRRPTQLSRTTLIQDATLFLSRRPTRELETPQLSYTLLSLYDIYPRHTFRLWLVACLPNVQHTSYNCPILSTSHAAACSLPGRLLSSECPAQAPLLRRWANQSTFNHFEML